MYFIIATFGVNISFDQEELQGVPQKTEAI